MNDTALELLNADPPKPGWEIWVVAGDMDHLDASLTGFLILTSEHLPLPICYIEGSGEVELLSARLIAAGSRSPECAMDLRGRELPRFIIGKVLVPEKFLSTRDRGAWPFVAAKFSGTPNGQVAGFCVLGPIFSESAAEIQHQMDLMKQLGDTTTEAEGKSALAIKKLQTDVSEAWSGIEKEAMKGFLDYVASHGDELEKTIVDISTAAREIIADVIPGITKLVGDLPGIVKDLDAIAAALAAVGQAVKPHFDKATSQANSQGAMGG